MEIAGEGDDTDDADAPEQADESATANQSADAEDDAAEEEGGSGEPNAKRFACRICRALLTCRLSKLVLPLAMKLTSKTR